MGEQIKKKFLLYFRLMLLVWIVIANAILHVINFQYSWLIFISNIMLFTMEEGTVSLIWASFSTGRPCLCF